MPIDFRTVDGAIEQVAKFCSMTNGQGMTPYSSELMVSYLQGAFEFIKADQEWDELTLRLPRVLDETTGKITKLITTTKDWKQIRRIYHESFQTPLPKVSSYVNPITGAAALILGYSGLPPELDNLTGDGRYLVQFYPSTLAGNVMFDIERTFDFNEGTTVIPIDWWMHVYHAAWQYCVDDGTNQGQAQKYEKLFATRLKQIKARENSRPVLMNPNQVVPNDWFEADAPYQ